MIYKLHFLFLSCNTLETIRKWTKDENEDTFEIRKLETMPSHMYMYMYICMTCVHVYVHVYMYIVTVTYTLEVYKSEECNNTHPIVLRHLISFSIRVADEVGIRCFNATFEDG